MCFISMSRVIHIRLNFRILRESSHLDCGGRIPVFLSLSKTYESRIIISRKFINEPYTALESSLIREQPYNDISTDFSNFVYSYYDINN